MAQTLLIKSTMSLADLNCLVGTEFDLKRPTVIGQRYTILNAIATGGMGAVYKARDEQTRAHVALKLLHSEHELTSRAARRFALEAIAMRRVSHPAVVRVLDAGLIEKRPYIVMELIDGDSLHDLIHRRGRLSAAQAVDIAVELCGALEATHAASIIHRDVKPSNILVDNASSHRLRVKLSDFGLARVDDYSMTRAYEAVGTPSFMAPEQAVGDAPDVRTDIHGLGTVLYMMLTGVTPFDGAGVDAKLARSVFTHAPLPSTRAKIPADLNIIVASTLRKDPANRYATAAALREDLERAAGRRPGAVLGAPLVNLPDAYQPHTPVSRRFAKQLEPHLAD